MKLQKLRKAGLRELRVRASQAWAAFVERRGWGSLIKLPNDHDLLGLLDPAQAASELRSAEDLLEHFRRRTSPQSFAAFTEKEATLKELRSRWPGAESKIVERAQRVLEGKFDLLGLRNLNFGNPLDWHLEPISGKRTPLVHWSRLDYLDPQLAGDKKVAWELNRHQHFTLLGRAYWLTADERYARAFVTHLESWMDRNPPKLGINWASSLEVAFRSISWLWGFYFFKDSSSLNSKTFMRAMKFLYLHARHLETYLSTYFSPNTHLTGEALGLFYLGTLLPEFKKSQSWKNRGRGILLDELSRQVRADGTYFEQTSYYHQYTTDFYAHFLLLSKANGEVLPDDVASKLRALLDHLMYITRPDGTTPLFGDDDGGRLMFTDRNSPNDFRTALSTGAVLFDRPDYKFVAQGAAEETLWLMGHSGLERFDSLRAQEPAKRSVGFHDGGYYVMRDSWGPKGNYVLFDCGPHGELSCGHAHADALSFELAANGRTLLVDPGTYTYTGSKEMRDWFRSSIAHNTLTIDGQSSSVPAGTFSWKEIARSETLNWISRKRFDYIEGRHSGYARLSERAHHTRAILFLKHDYWIIRDRVSQSGTHRADLWFHFNPEVVPIIEALNGQAAVVTDASDEPGIDIAIFSHSGQWKREEGWVSQCYGERSTARVYAYSATLDDTGEFITFLLPSSGRSAAKASVRESEALGGRAFEVSHENGLDIVMIRDSGSPRVETERLASDFAWTWIRFPDREATTPTEVMLLAGTTFELEGQRILKSEAPIDFLVASQSGDQMRLEANRSVLDLPLAVSDFETVGSRQTFTAGRRI